MLISQLRHILIHNVVSKDKVLALLSQLTTVTDKKGQTISDEYYNYLFRLLPNTHYIYVMYSEKGEIAEEEEQLVGMGTLIVERKLVHGGNPVGHIEDIVIDKKYRGKSYGKKLIDFLINKCKEAGCYKVILNCDEKNVGFYEKFGFQQKNVEMSMYLE